MLNIQQGINNSKYMSEITLKKTIMLRRAAWDQTL